MSMIRVFLTLAFFISIVALPWWVIVAVAIFYLAEGGSIFLVIAGGILADMLFGAPVASLYGFSYLYTVLMAALGLTAYYLRRALFE